MIILTPNAHHVKNQKILQSIYWTLKKLTSPHLVKKGEGEWEEINEIYRKNKKKKEVTVIEVQDLNKTIKESRKNGQLREKGQGNNINNNKHE